MVESKDKARPTGGQREEEGHIKMWKRWLIFYPPEEEDTIVRFRAWCKEHTANKYVPGIKMLMYLADLQTHYAHMAYEIAQLKAKIAELEGGDKEEEGPDVPATLGGKEEDE